MPRIDVQRNAPRRAVRRSHHNVARGVRQDRAQVIRQLAPRPRGLPSNDLARTGARAGVRPKPARRRVPSPARPSNDLARTGARAGINPTAIQLERHITTLFTRGGSLREKQDAANALRNMGVLPAIRYSRPGRPPAPRKQGGAFGEAVAHIPGVGGALKFGYSHLPTFGRIATDMATLGGAEVPWPVIGNPLKAFGEGIGRGAQETLDIPAETVPAIYHLGDLAVHGHAREVARELVSPYVEAAKHPLRSLKEQPVHTALLALGVKGGAARGLGTVGRFAERVPESVPGTSIVERRQVARDIVTRKRQAVQEVRKMRRAEQLRRDADALEAENPDEALKLRRRANEVDPRVMNENRVARRLDERVAANEGVRRASIGETLRTMRKAVRRNVHPMVSLVAQHIVDPDVRDWEAYLGELKAQAESGRLGPGKKAANRVTQRVLRGAIQDARAGKIKMDRLETQAAEYARATLPLQDELAGTGMYSREELELARLKPFATRRLGGRIEPEHHVLKETGERLPAGDVNRMRAVMSPKEFRALVAKVPERFVDAAGKPLTVERIRAEMRAHGERRGAEMREPAWVSHSPGGLGRGAFFQMWYPRSTTRGRVRTGEAVRSGLMPVDRTSLVESPAKVRSIVEADRGFKAFIGEFGLRNHRTGRLRAFLRYEGKGSAMEAARDLERTTGMKWRAVRINPLMGSHRPLHQLLEETGAAQDAVADTLRGSMEHALERAHEGAGPWALVPDAAAAQLADHMRVLGPGSSGRVLHAVTSAFRRTVLATSTKWATGNVVEAAVRNAIMRAGPVDWYRASRAIRELERTDPAKAMELKDRIGSGHFGFQERQRVHRDLSQWVTERSPRWWRGTVAGLEAMRSLPPARAVSGAWGLWTHMVFGGMAKIEGQARLAMFGQAMSRAGMKSVEQAAEGLRNTNEQVRFARMVDRAYGQYDKWSPDMRRYIALYTPFVAWSLNAVKFLADVLPRDHPVLTSLLASANQATEEWRKAHGLKEFMDGAAPGWLQGSIPVAGGHKRFQYTPFAIAGDPLDSAAGLLLPQFEGVQMALRGKDWKGDDLPAGTQKGWYALKALAGATIPLVGTVTQVVQKGPEKTFNPIATIPENTSGGGGGASIAVPGRAGRILEHIQARETDRQQNLSPGAQKILDEIQRRYTK